MFAYRSGIFVTTHGWCWNDDDGWNTSWFPQIQMIKTKDFSRKKSHIIHIFIYHIRCRIPPIMPLFHWPAMPRRSYGVRKMNSYAVRSPRGFGGTSPALLLRTCCVSTEFQWRMGDAHVAHMAHEWRCYCVWCRVWQPYHCVSTAQVAYAQHTSHVRAAINAILWRTRSVCTAHWLRTCGTYKYTSLYMWDVNVTLKCSVEYICI